MSVNDPAAEALLREIFGKPGPKCDAEFARHPSMPHLVAICTLPIDHEGEHDNVLRKPEPTS